MHNDVHTTHVSGWEGERGGATLHVCIRRGGGSGATLHVCMHQGFGEQELNLN